MKIRIKTVIGYLAPPLLLAGTFVLALCWGSFWISPADIFAENGLEAGVVRLRLIRCATAFIIGGGLAVSGAAYQAVLKNPLAEPYILGISGGASLGAAAALISGLAAVSGLAVPLTAFVAALLALTLVLAVSRGCFGGVYSENILLSGVIVGSVCSSWLMFIISGLGYHELNSITWWMLGNMEAGDLNLLLTAWIITLSGTALLAVYGRHANVIALGEEMAYNMGVAPVRTALTMLGTASLITAAAVSLSGIIGFVGLIVPHAMRRLFGADHRRLFILNLFYGGIFLVLCDTVARSILASQEIPVGVITALIGGPFFIWLLNQRTRTGHD
ncbi:MAG: iron ABC transporter permease [Victivallaceae bacterium]|nr:iron ABC transporter permease [Victivallaceae bacterium]